MMPLMSNDSDLSTCVSAESRHFDLAYKLLLKIILMLLWIQSDHLSGKPGNVREFDSCQGNVRDFTKYHKMSGKKFCPEKLLKTVYCTLHICVHTGN